VIDQHTPAALAAALGLPPPTDEQAAVIAAPPGPLVVIAGAGAGKTETMAARVVWLVANGYAAPHQVLGLTFTRKAAGQLLRRVRSRLARLAGSGLLTEAPALGTGESVTVSTYHAFAGTLLREYGLLLPVEPDSRLLSETELWQLAFEVVCAYPGELDTERNPAGLTAMVLRLSGQLAEHLVTTDQLRASHRELEQLVHTLPPGPGQRDSGPTQWLQNILATQVERTELIPLVDALHERLRAERAMDFGMQMAAAARLAQQCPQVGAEIRRRYRVVLLDEYQDTGHAQRVALSALFGGGADDAPALTAVGDPIQSIYGWRGASATNLPRFTTDFPRPDGSPAPALELRTSWRNPPSTLHVANEVSAEARHRSVAVGALRPRPGAPDGTVRAALLSDVVAERDWVADEVARRYHDGVAETGTPPTTAVLVRRNADAAPMAAALRARGVAVEVVGLAGLLGIDEVAEVVAMLRLAADPTAGTAALRVLTGQRWRLGARDLTALWQRARTLVDSAAGAAGTAQIVAAAGPEADLACLADAICDPGPADRYSAAGHERIGALADELTVLRGHLDHPVADVVAEVRRTLGVDVEVRAAGGGPEHLDAFADIVDRYAQWAGTGGVHGLLAFLQVAEERESGLAPADVHTTAGTRVQIMTVHAAKGLEWQVVAVPHLSARVFPSTASTGTWLTDASELPPLLRGDRSEPGAQGVPVLDTSQVTNRKQLSDTIAEHRDQLARRRVDEERRLLYVAVTRAEDTLLLSGHHWAATGLKPRGPSDFLCELKDIIDRAAAAGRPCGEIDQWAPAPADGDLNPLRDSIIEASWPAEPDAGGTGLQRGADLVAQALRGPAAPTPGIEVADPHGWIADVDALLAERAAEADPVRAVLPPALSVSSLVELGRDRPRAVERMRRRLPVRPDSNALLGTAFHDWVQRFYGADRLIDLDDLPGAVDGDVGSTDADELALLQEAFIDSSWAGRTPVDVEVPFEMAIGDRVVRGRIDAIFADADGGVTVLDWKTGAAPVGAEVRRHAAIQLGVYRLAVAALRGCPVSQVRTAFHYVREGRTVVCAQPPGADELAGLLDVSDTSAEA
jgi:DNA helicase II / ATP-dependent DNA helicase PcrA